jgi:hypothetical protein
MVNEEKNRRIIWEKKEMKEEEVISRRKRWK